MRFNRFKRTTGRMAVCFFAIPCGKEPSISHHSSLLTRVGCPLCAHWSLYEEGIDRNWRPRGQENESTKKNSVCESKITTTKTELRGETEKKIMKRNPRTFFFWLLGNTHTVTVGRRRLGGCPRGRATTAGNIDHSATTSGTHNSWPLLLSLGKRKSSRRKG